jgi:4-hydroxybenzoate polyprenyltransferase
VVNRLTAWRDGVRRTPGGRQLLKLGVFLLGLVFVLLGVALVVLPGPLTIPPILLGVWIWSTEFAWADRLKDRAVDSAREAWEAARRRPVTSAVVTGGGLLLAVVCAIAVRRYDVVDRVTGSFG